MAHRPPLFDVRSAVSTMFRQRHTRRQQGVMRQGTAQTKQYKQMDINIHAEARRDSARSISGTVENGVETLRTLLYDV